MSADTKALDEPDSLSTWQRIAPYVTILTVGAVHMRARRDDRGALAGLRRDRALSLNWHLAACHTLCDLTIPASTSALNALASMSLRSLLALTLAFSSESPTSGTALIAAIMPLSRLATLALRGYVVLTSTAVALFLAIGCTPVETLSFVRCRAYGILGECPDDPVALDSLLIDNSTQFGAVALSVIAPYSLTLAGTDGSGAPPLPPSGCVIPPGRVCVDAANVSAVAQLAQAGCPVWFLAFPSADAGPDIGLLETIIALLRDETAFRGLRQIATSGTLSSTRAAAIRRNELIREMYAEACRRMGVAEDAEKPASFELDETFRTLRGQTTRESQVRRRSAAELMLQIRKYRALPRSPRSPRWLPQPAGPLTPRFYSPASPAYDPDGGLHGPDPFYSSAYSPASLAYSPASPMFSPASPYYGPYASPQSARAAAVPDFEL